MFSSIFAEDTIANSNYNSLQVSLEKRFTHGSQARWLTPTASPSIRPRVSKVSLTRYDFHSTYSLSQFDARNRVVFHYDWEVASA